MKRNEYVAVEQANSGRTCGFLGLDFFGTSECVALDTFNLVTHVAVLRGIEPDVFPIPVANARSETSSNRVEHVLQVRASSASCGIPRRKTSLAHLSGVNIGGAVGTVTGEVIGENAGVMTNIAEVDGLATTFEKK